MKMKGSTTTAILAVMSWWCKEFLIREKVKLFREAVCINKKGVLSKTHMDKVILMKTQRYWSDHNQLIFLSQM